MRNEYALSTLADINRMWNLVDRYWPTREMDIASAAFPIDIYEQDGRVFVRASLPGVKPEDLKLSFEQHVLTITGETNEQYEEKPGSRRYLREHAYGRFVRSVRLPDDIDDQEIDAQFENGVLTVSLGLTRRRVVEPKQIPIRGVPSNQPISGRAYADRAGDEKQNSGKPDKQAVSPGSKHSSN